jgi:hypothetical protein
VPPTFRAMEKIKMDDELFGEEPIKEPVSEVVIETTEEVAATQEETPPQKEEVSPPNPLEGYVPIAVMKAEREKRQNAERILEQVYGSLDHNQPQEYYEEPQYFAEPIPQISESDIRMARINIQLSEIKAVQSFGAEEVAAAKLLADELVNTNPDLLNSIQFGEDPFGDLIRYKQQTEILSNPEAFIRKNAPAYGFRPANPEPEVPQAVQKPIIKSTSSLAGGAQAAARPNNEDALSFF